MSEKMTTRLTADEEQAHKAAQYLERAKALEGEHWSMEMAMRIVAITAKLRAQNVPERLIDRAVEAYIGVVERTMKGVGGP